MDVACFDNYPCLYFWIFALIISTGFTMKILFVTHGTINFEEKRNFYDSFIEMGYDAIYFNYVDKHYYRGQYGEGNEAGCFNDPNQKLIDVANSFNPDLIFSILHRDQIKYETFGELRKQGFKIINWFCDDTWRFNDFSRFWIPYLDYAVTTAREALDWYHAYGWSDKVILSNWAANPRWYKPMDVEKKYDVVFVGGAHGGRKEIIEKTKQAGIDVRAFGKGFESGRVGFDDLIKKTSEAKINLNFARCSGDNGSQMKARNFELPACGAFTLTEYIKGIEDYFDPHEMTYWHDVGDLIDSIRYYLEHEEEREEKALNGMNRVLREHTYEHRFKEIFDRIGLK